MQNQIRENSIQVTEYKNKFLKIEGFVKLPDLYGKDIMKSLMEEIVPRMREEAHNIARELVKTEVNSYVLKTDYRNEFDKITIKINDTFEIAEANLNKINW